MQIIVLTGGLGAGKSTAARYFRGRGAVVFCLDTIARDLMPPGSELLQRVAGEFGAGVVAADGSLDREALSRVAFASPQATERLNAIVHPAVVAEVESLVRRLRQGENATVRVSADSRDVDVCDVGTDTPAVVVIEVPLLAEAPVFIELADQVLAVAAPKDVRLARAMGAGFGEADARRRIALQASDAERAAMADTVIANDADVASFLRKLDDYWAEHIATSPPA